MRFPWKEKLTKQIKKGFKNNFREKNVLSKIWESSHIQWLQEFSQKRINQEKKANCHFLLTICCFSQALSVRGLWAEFSTLDIKKVFFLSLAFTFLKYTQ
jgi:hypothetical protein